MAQQNVCKSARSSLRGFMVRSMEPVPHSSDDWRTQELGAVRYLVFDATYVKVRQAGSVIDCAVLIAAGFRADGKRSILGCSVSRSEAEVH